jgi:predicted phosphatase
MKIHALKSIDLLHIFDFILKLHVFDRSYLPYDKMIPVLARAMKTRRNMNIIFS